MVEPLKKLLINGKAVSGEFVKERLFGGFCNCGGVMLQKLWINSEDEAILIAECEKCWKNQAKIFNSLSFIGQTDVTVLDKSKFKQFLNKVLSGSEYEALVNKALGQDYQPSALSRAKKKLAEMNLEIDDVLDILK